MYCRSIQHFLLFLIMWIWIPKVAEYGSILDPDPTYFVEHVLWFFIVILFFPCCCSWTLLFMLCCLVGMLLLFMLCCLVGMLLFLKAVVYALLFGGHACCCSFCSCISYGGVAIYILFKPKSGILVSCKICQFIGYMQFCRLVWTYWCWGIHMDTCTLNIWAVIRI